MTSPVTGPFSATITHLGPSIGGGARETWYHSSKVWYKQKKPYNLPLYYLHQIREISSASADFAATFEVNQAFACDTRVGNTIDKLLAPAATASYNKAYSRFIEELKPAQAELLAAAAEYQQSLDMIAKRASQLAKAVAQARVGNVGGALVTLGQNPRDQIPPRRRRKRNPWGKAKPYQAADLYLEYAFGWKPLINDISNAVKHLAGGLPSFRVRGRSNLPYSYTETTGNLTTGKSSISCTYKSGHVIRARIRATNPNAALANELGLVNTVFALWEVTPWSFVLDYFVNVGEWLNGFTDLIGFDLTETSWTWRCEAHSNQSLEWVTTSPSRSYTAVWSGDRFELHRNIGSIPGPMLAIREPWRLSASRAATSVSLLIQQLQRAKR